jgi:methylenetetrahydrofolate reductase (NADPH)
MDRMRTTLQPLFTDMTWGAGGSTADVSLELALHAQSTGHVANLHLTCTNLTNGKDTLLHVLQRAKDGRIRNIVALRGDAPAGQDTWTVSDREFTCALDLVKFIHEHFPNTFGVAVAGYPEGHPNAISQVTDVSALTETEHARASCVDGVTYVCLDGDYAKEMSYLKKKVDAGAGTRVAVMVFVTILTLMIKFSSFSFVPKLTLSHALTQT